MSGGKDFRQNLHDSQNDKKRNKNNSVNFVNPVKKILVPKLRFSEFHDAGEWKIKPMERLFTIGNGKDHKHLPDGDIPVYGSGGYMRSVNKYLYEGESACIGRKGTIDKPVFLTGKFWTVDTLFYTHSFKDCLPKFAYLIFQNVNWRSHNEAGGVPSLSKANINKIDVACPKPDEQQKIADCLSSIDELITAHSQKYEALKAHKKGLMQQLFPTEGETVPQLRFPEFRGAGEWEDKKLGDLSKILRGGSPRPIDDYITLEASGLNWLKIADVNKDAKYVTCTKERVFVTALSKTREVNPGDLIMSNSMSFGRPYILKIKTCIHDGWIAVTEIDEQTNRDYLYYLILSPESQAYFLKNAAGSGVQNLNADIIKLLQVLIPKDPKEQQKIADCLSSFDELITAQAKKMESLKTHKKGLMQQLFPVTDEVRE